MPHYSGLSVLEQYSYDIIHCKGSDHANADALSRIVRKHCSRTNCPDCSQNRTEETDQFVEHLLAPVTRSRNQQHSSGTNVSVDPVTSCQWLDSWSREQLLDWQRQDTDIKPVLQWKEESERKPNWNTVSSYSHGTKTLHAQWHQLHMEDGLLYREWHPQGLRHTRDVVNQLVAPERK